MDGMPNSLALQWSRRKLYTLMFVIYNQNEGECPPKMANADIGVEFYEQKDVDSKSEDVSKSWVLLGLKQRGFGTGRWNGFGGKVQSDDADPKEAALRELKEECGLEIGRDSTEEVGRLWFTFTDQTECMEVHVFICRDWKPSTIDTGWPCNTEEMHPDWFPVGSLVNGNSVDVSGIPFSHMWSDDQFWFPHMLRCHQFVGWFHFNPLSELGVGSSKIPADKSSTTNGLMKAPYEVPAYRLQVFLDDGCMPKKGFSEADESFQLRIAKLGLEEDSALKKWMSSREKAADLPNSQLVVFG
ncbi:unnamed protein product [Calicophoron daubneyi]|uniref:Nudix hydrolase domain-containing protein n=1 Tax=Calicophoron daubneyi TaxID=300641 RepID=A0AAV2TDU7_CALDB